MNKIAYLEGYMEKESTLRLARAASSLVNPFYRANAVGAAISPHLSRVNNISTAKDIAGNIYHGSELVHTGKSTYNGVKALNSARSKGHGVYKATRAAASHIPKALGVTRHAATAAAKTGARAWLGKIGPASWAADMALDAGGQMLSNPVTGKLNMNVSKNVVGNANNTIRKADKTGIVGRAWDGLVNPVRHIMAAGVATGQTAGAVNRVSNQNKLYKQLTGSTLRAGSPISDREVRSANINMRKTKPKVGAKLQNKIGVKR